MSKEAQEYYQVLNDEGTLKEVFPRATGLWEKDKKRFTKYYVDNIKFILDFENGNLNEDSDDYIDDYGDSEFF